MIFEEGVHFNIPEAEYRSADGVSQSLLKEFGNAATPKHFQVREPRVATADMELGTVVHAAILTPEKFAESYHLQPLEYPAVVKGKDVMKPWHGGSDWCTEWLLEHSDRPVMTRKKLEKIPKIKASLESLQPFGAALKHGRTEVAFFKRDGETGLMLKCRVDLIATDAEGYSFIFDLKKVGSGCATGPEFSKQAWNLGYHIQASFYLEVTGASRFVFVPFDDDKPFCCCQWETSPTMLDEGRKAWRNLLNTYAKCVRDNDWPGYHTGIEMLHPPSFVKV